MNKLFEFESDFAQSLRCIPMLVRLKLDTCGVKLKLPQWNQFTQDDRALLIELPCESTTEIEAYRTTLRQLVLDRTGTEASGLSIAPSPSWLDEQTVPASVQTKANEVGEDITSAQWAALTSLQRFALIKLSLSGHENRNFLPALKEFHVVR